MVNESNLRNDPRWFSKVVACRYAVSSTLLSDGTVLHHDTVVKRELLCRGRMEHLWLSSAIHHSESNAWAVQ